MQLSKDFNLRLSIQELEALADEPNMVAADHCFQPVVATK